MCPHWSNYFATMTAVWRLWLAFWSKFDLNISPMRARHEHNKHNVNGCACVFVCVCILNVLFYTSQPQSNRCVWGSCDCARETLATLARMLAYFTTMSATATPSASLNILCGGGGNYCVLRMSAHRMIYSR